MKHPTSSSKRTTTTAPQQRRSYFISPIPLTPNKHNKVFCMRLAEKEKKKPKQKGNEGMHHKDDAMTSIERATLMTSIEISGRFCVTVTGSDY